MAGTGAWPTAQKDSTHTPVWLRGCQHQAAAGWRDRGCSELASGPEANVYDGKPTIFWRDRSLDSFLAKYSYQISRFQSVVFVKFEAAQMRKPHELYDPDDERLLTPTRLLSTLDLLEDFEGCDEDYAQNFIEVYGWVKPAWEGIVHGLGLSASDYAALRQFQKYSYDRLHVVDDERWPQQALAELESSTVPEGLEAIKGPLARLLTILAKLFPQPESA